jgi:ATP adenylyltransferase
MEYIGQKQEPGCLFCRVLEAPDGDDRENLVVARPGGVVVMMNKFPYNNGHLLVAPSAHVGSLADLDGDQSARLMSAVQLALRVLQSEMRPDGFNVGANQGEVAGAGIPGHIHMHVVPRWGGDTNFMPVLAEVKVINEHLDRGWEKLHAAFSGAS